MSVLYRFKLYCVILSPYLSLLSLHFRSHHFLSPRFSLFILSHYFHSHFFFIILLYLLLIKLNINYTILILCQNQTLYCINLVQYNPTQCNVIQYNTSNTI